MTGTSNAIFGRVAHAYAWVASIGVFRFSSQWLLPLTLAVVMFGQLGFSLLQFRFGVAHPAWPFWLALAVLTGIFGWRALTRLGWQDAIFGLILLTLVVAFFRGQAPANEFALQFVGFLVLPYVAARTIDAQDIWRFLVCAVLVCVVVMVIAIVEIRSLPPEMLMEDRILLFFDRVVSGAGGVASQPYVSAAMGGLLAISTVTLLCGPPNLALRVLMGVVGLFLASLLLVFAGTRAVMVAALVIVAGNVVWNNRHSWMFRTGVLAIVVLGAVAGAQVSSAARIDFIAHVIMPGPAAGAVIASEPEEIRSCLPKGISSIAIRAYLLEQAWGQFIQNPLFGVGLGNFAPSCEVKYVPFDSPHNIVVHALAEGGLVAGGMFVALMVSPLVLLRRRNMLIPMAVVSIYLLFAIWETMSGSMFGDGHFYAALGLAVTAARHVSGPWGSRAPLKLGVVGQEPLIGLPDSVR